MNTLPNNLVLTNTLYAVCPDAVADILGGKTHPEIKGKVKFYHTTYGGILIEAEIFNLPKKAPEGSPDFLVSIYMKMVTARKILRKQEDITIP